MQSIDASDLARADIRSGVPGAPQSDRRPGSAGAAEAKQYAICWLDLNGRVSRWNPGSEEIFGYSTSEAASLHFRQLFSPDDRGRDAVDVGLARVRAEGSWEEVGWHLRRGGARFWGASSVTLVRTPNDVEIGCLVVTRRLEAPAESDDALAPGAFRLVSVGRVAAHLAHEVGNILSAVRGFAGLLERHLPVEGASHDVWRELVQTCDRGTTFTRTLLGVGHQGDDALATVDVADLVHRMEPLLRQVLTERITLMTSVEGDLPKVVGRLADLELVLLNLVVNARDAIQGEGRIVITAGIVSYGGERSGRRVVLTVRDSGSGMSLEVKERVFDDFFTTKGVHSGTGLGLALVRETVRACGGSIEVESEVGSGTSMSIGLCVAQEAAYDRRFGPVEASGASRRADVVLLQSGPESPQDVVVDLLKRHGLGVVVVGSAAEARQAIAMHGASVILALSGTSPEVLASSRPAGVGPRAILLSGAPSASHPVALPGDRVLPEGFCPDLLMAEVEQVLSDAALSRTARLH